MTREYIVHFPDGSEYGPVDRATLLAWRDEGRLPGEVLVWPDGAPAWMSADEALVEPQPFAAPAPVLEPEAASPAAAAAPAIAVPAAATSDAAAPAAAPDSSSASARVAARDSGAVLAPAASIPPSASSPPAPRAGVAPSPAPAGPGSDTLPPSPRGRLAAARLGRARRHAPTVPPRLLVLGIGAVALLALLFGAWSLVRPWVAKRAEVAAVRRHALPDRRVEDRAVGLAADLPPGWLALRPDNPYVTAPHAILRLAEPSVPVFASVTMVARPRHMDALDAHLDELLQDRVPKQPSMKPGGRADVQLGRGKGRLVRTTWDEGLVPMQGETVAWADGYDIFTLDAEAPLAVGSRLAEEVAALCRGLAATGLLEGRVSEAVDRLAVDVPELSREALRLLVAERMSQGRDLADVPQAALRMVSRGLDALAPGEAAEMRAIYQQVWAPVEDAERVRSAALMAEIKAGRPVPDAALASLRGVVKTGVLALPPEQRTRLQELSTRAVRKSLLLP